MARDDGGGTLETRHGRLLGRTTAARHGRKHARIRSHARLPFRCATRARAMEGDDRRYHHQQQHRHGSDDDDPPPHQQRPLHHHPPAASHHDAHPWHPRRRARPPPTGVFYGEVVASAPESTPWTALGIVQMLVAAWLLVTAVVLTVEAMGAPVGALWTFALFYAVVSAALVVVAQPITTLMYMRGNRIPHPPHFMRHSLEGNSYMTMAHTKEALLGMLASIFAVALVTWTLLDYLLRFQGQCCESRAPLVDQPREYNAFSAGVTLSAAISYAALYPMLRAVWAHWRPLRSITHLVAPPR